MAKFNYAKLQAKAGKVIDRFGAALTAVRPGSVEWVSGEEVEQPEITYPIIGVKYDYAPKEIDGTHILAGDCKFIVSGAYDVRVGDIIPIDGKAHRVISSGPIKPAAVGVAYILQMRG